MIVVIKRSRAGAEYFIFQDIIFVNLVQPLCSSIYKSFHLADVSAVEGGLVYRIQDSAAMRCRVNPIQNAIPKNSRGDKEESAKNAPTMGRTVATARPIAKARSNHSLYTIHCLANKHRTAWDNEKRKYSPNNAEAAVSFAPPIESLYDIPNADMPTPKAAIKNKMRTHG